MTLALRERVAHELRLVGVAAQFLTRLPVPLRGFDPDWLHASARHFPLVGALVGVCAGAVLWGASLLWPAEIAVLLSMAASVWITGAFHEDGLADTCDGLGGAVSREKALVIMKDSRLGSYGAIGLVLTLALKATALVALARVAPAMAAAASVLAHTVSRACAVALIGALPYAGDADHAKAKPLAQGTGARTVIAACGSAAIVALALLLATHAPGATWVRWGVAIACAAAVAAWCARWFRRRLGGYTGDTLGAAQQWSELAFYLALVAHALRG